MRGNLIVQEHTEQGYKVVFNTKTGAFVRSENKGVKEPFWSKAGPELLDFSITNYCTRECNFCYRQSSHLGHHMNLGDIQNIICQAKEADVLQIALGGGNPNQHPDFIKVLKLIKETGMVPSYTTNGLGLTDDILKATSMYCGAMAVSFYPPYDLEKYACLVEWVTSYHIRINLHVIIKNDTIELMTKLLKKSPPFFTKLNAIIFLNYKPIGEGLNYAVDDVDALKRFFEAANNCKSVKIGFDSCSMSGIVKWMRNIKPVFLESCEAARFSAFISEDMKMYPCSFMVGTKMYGDLRYNSLKEIWRNSLPFKSFRRKIQTNDCHGCEHEKLCKGGCLFLPEINMCTLKH